MCLIKSVTIKLINNVFNHTLTSKITDPLENTQTYYIVHKNWISQAIEILWKAAYGHIGIRAFKVFLRGPTTSYDFCWLRYVFSVQNSSQICCQVFWDLTIGKTFRKNITTKPSNQHIRMIVDPLEIANMLNPIGFFDTSECWFHSLSIVRPINRINGICIPECLVIL